MPVVSDDVANSGGAAVSVSVFVFVQLGVVFCPLETLGTVRTFRGVFNTEPTQAPWRHLKTSTFDLEEKGFVKYPVDLVNSIGKRGSKV